MKKQAKWLIISASLASAILCSDAAYSVPVQTPLPSGFTVNGVSEGTSSGQCGFVSSTPSQVIQVTEDFTSLRFVLQGEGEPTFLIVGPGGRSQCVVADRFSEGAIEVPGVWERGTYSLFVGDRTQGNHPYTLNIIQEN